MKKKRVLKNKFKYFFGFYLIFLFLLIIKTSMGKYTSSLGEKSTTLTVAKPVIKLNIETPSSNDVVNGGDIVRYFSVSNKDNNVVTEVGLDYYIYVVDENDNLINNTHVYFQIDNDNPNEFQELTQISSGVYSGYFETSGFTINEETHNYKLVVNNVSGFNQVNIKVKAVQKRVSE